MAAERIRQNSLDKEADALNLKSQDNYQDFEGKQDETSTKLADYFTGQQVAEPTPEVALPTTSSNITVQEEAKQRAQAKDFTDRTGTALGELRSFGDLLGQNSRLQARTGMEIGQIGGYKRGSSNVLSYELDAANSKGQGLRTFGDILGGLGGIATNAGLSGPGMGVNYFPAAPTPTVTLGSILGAPARSSTLAAGRALDRASVPGYSLSPYGG